MHELELSPAFQLLVGFLIDWLIPDAWRQSLRVSRERLIQRLEYGLYIAHSSEQERLQQGILALVMTLLPVIAVAFLLTRAPAAGWLFSGFLLGLMLGWARQARYTRAFLMSLQKNTSIEACYIVEKMPIPGQPKIACDTSTKQNQLVSHTIAWLLTTGHSKILGVVFWFVLLGAPGAILYRMITTFSEHWDVEHHRYKSFGRPATWLAKLMNWLPHHLTILTYCLAGHFSAGYRSITLHYSGYPFSSDSKALIASGCGSLGFTVQLPPDISLGEGKSAKFDDCHHARHLINVCCLSWIVIISLGHFI